jgi:HAD superfamily hydrolase (TIGR01509 family)
VDGWHHHLNQLLASAKALPGAYDLIHSLHSRGIPIALATSSLRQAVAIKRQCHEAMFACFSAIVCGDDVRAGKPAPDIFLRAAELLFVDPKHCVVFEDSPSGVTAGVRAEMHTVAVPDSRMLHSPAFSHATNVLPSLKHFKVDEWF